MTNDFEKGREYEQLSQSVSRHRTLGFACIITLLIIIVVFIIGKGNNFPWGLIFLLFFLGILSLYLWISERKELKEMKDGK